MHKVLVTGNIRKLILVVPTFGHIAKIPYRGTEELYFFQRPFVRRKREGGAVGGSVAHNIRLGNLELHTSVGILDIYIQSLQVILFLI